MNHFAGAVHSHIPSTAAKILYIDITNNSARYSTTPVSYSASHSPPPLATSALLPPCRNGLKRVSKPCTNARANTCEFCARLPLICFGPPRCRSISLRPLTQITSHDDDGFKLSRADCHPNLLTSVLTGRMRRRQIDDVAMRLRLGSLTAGGARRAHGRGGSLKARSTRIDKSYESDVALHGEANQCGLTSPVLSGLQLSYICFISTPPPCTSPLRYISPESTYNLYLHAPNNFPPALSRAQQSHPGIRISNARRNQHHGCIVSRSHVHRHPPHPPYPISDAMIHRAPFRT